MQICTIWLEERLKKLLAWHFMLKRTFLHVTVKKCSSAYVYVVFVNTICLFWISFDIYSFCFELCFSEAVFVTFCIGLINL